MIQLQNIGIKRDDWVLRNIDLEIEEGDIIGVIGQSGIGKTTLLKLMSGLLDASEGHVLFNGKKLIGPAEKLIPGYEDIQLVNQDFALEPYHTVRQNVKEKVLNLHQEDQDFIVDEYLQLVDLSDIEDRKAHVLSGGEQQRLSIARALACEPKVLLLDEPFVHIDQRLRLKIINYLLKLNEVRKTSILLVSHDGAEIMGFAKKVIHIAKEGVQRIDTLDNIFYRPDSFEQGQLMGGLNKVTIEGNEVLFRPNEYTVEGQELKLKFINYLDTGLAIYNYFQTDLEEEVVLVSIEPLDTISSIKIKRK